MTNQDFLNDWTTSIDRPTAVLFQIGDGNVQGEGGSPLLGLQAGSTANATGEARTKRLPMRMKTMTKMRLVKRMKKAGLHSMKKAEQKSAQTLPKMLTPLSRCVLCKSALFEVPSKVVIASYYKLDEALPGMC